MNKALKAAMEGEWLKADKPSEEALKKTPDNVNALILRALICEKLNRYDEAVGNAIKAVTVDSSSFAATTSIRPPTAFIICAHQTALVSKCVNLRSTV